MFECFIVEECTLSSRQNPDDRSVIRQLGDKIDTGGGRQSVKHLQNNNYLIQSSTDSLE